MMTAIWLINTFITSHFCVWWGGENPEILLSGQISSEAAILNQVAGKGLLEKT